MFFLILNNFIASPFKMITAQVDVSGVMHLDHPAPTAAALLRFCNIRKWSSIRPCFIPAIPDSAIPFAFGLAALIGRYPGEKWIHLTRRWTMIAWCFQSIGVLLGAHWAYAVLGWGGYWPWDPVENASLMPWLIGTAFLHSVMMQEKRGMMKVWNVWLVFITFMLCIFGTTLTRSGMISSVHAFALIGDRAVVLRIPRADFYRLHGRVLKNRDYLKSDNHLDSLISRESSFLFNNLILLVACVAVLSGTMFPVLSEWITGQENQRRRAIFQSHQYPYWPDAPLPHRSRSITRVATTSVESLRRNFGWPMLGGFIAAQSPSARAARHLFRSPA